MRSWVRRVLQILLVAFVAAQFFPIHRDNPPVDPAQTLYATSSVPANVHAVFERSCRDCHSNATAWPWYSHFAPVSWMIADDVHGGRKHFNLSEWNTYPEEKKIRKLGEICEQVKTGEMPDEKYTLVHRGTSLSREDKTMLCDWTDGLKRTMIMPPVVAPPSASPSPAGAQ
jgi:Haem-binding domain